MRKIIKFPIVLLILLFFTTPAAALSTPYPWLDFGFNFSYDGVGSYTSTSVYTLGATYKDGSTAQFGADPILLSQVDLDLSLDGVQNDTITVNGWFTADVILKGSFDPVAQTPNPFTANLDNLLVLNTSGTSQWLNEFLSVMNPSDPYDGQLLLTFMASSGPADDGSYTINGAGKVAPVPEPATMLLLGTGLVGLAGVGRKKMFKK